VHVRGVGVDDALLILDLLERDGAAGVLAHAQPTLADVRAFLADHAADAFLAESDDHPVGVVMFHQQGDVLWVFRLAVLETVRGRGVGKRLIAAVEARARGANASAVFVQVQKDSQAQSFFERIGYRVDNEEREVVAGQPIVMVDLVRIVDAT
jgi:N-acetylglutamate synthase-like GNAT family acetyltransferase